VIVLRLESFRRRREVLDIGEKDRELLALGVNGDVLLSAENALVDLRRNVARYLHRKRGEKFVGGFELRIHALDNCGLTPLQGDEQESDRSNEEEIGQQILEREQVAADRLGDGDLLQAANVADLPVALRAVGVGVVAGDAGRRHDHRCHQPNAIDEKRVRIVGEYLIWICTQPPQRIRFELIKRMRRAVGERVIGNKPICDVVLPFADDVAEFE